VGLSKDLGKGQAERDSRIEAPGSLGCYLGGVLPPGHALAGAEARKVTKMSQPRYPATAFRMKVEGVVKLGIVVNADGSVEDVTVVSGHTLLKSAAAECVKQWKFEPATTKTNLNVEVTFRLPK
jgi:TonB family protein